MLKARRAALVLAAVLLASGCGWAQYRAGPEGTGYNALESTLTVGNVAQLAPAWSRDVGWIEPGRHASYLSMDGLSPLARSGSDLAVASLGGSVVLDATTGALRVPIQHSFPVPNDDRSVAIGEGRVVLSGGGSSSPAGKVSIHDLATGAAIQDGGGCAVNPSAPVISGGRLYSASRSCVGAHETSVSSSKLSDPTDQASWWTASTCCEPNFAPAVAGGRVYFLQWQPTTPRRLAALDATTGAVRWGTPITPPCPLTAPTVSGGRVYTSGETFDAATGAKLWSWPTCAVSSVVTVTPASLFVPYRSSTGASRLQAVDPATGAPQWSIPWNENVHARPSIPAAANGLLFAAGGNKLVARDASNGAVLWRSPAIAGTFSDPIVADGMVFAMASDGAVHAYALP